MHITDPFAIAGVIVLCLVSILAFILLFCVARRAGIAEHKKQGRASAMLNVIREVGDFYRPPSMFTRDYQPVARDNGVSTEMQPMPAATTTASDTAREQTAYQPLTTFDSPPPQSTTTVPNVVILPATPPRTQRSGSHGTLSSAIPAPATDENRRKSRNRDSLQLPGRRAEFLRRVDEATSRAEALSAQSSSRNGSPTPGLASAAPHADHATTSTRAAQAEGVSPRTSVQSLAPPHPRASRAQPETDDNMRLPQSSAYPPMPVRVLRPEQRGARQCSDRANLPSERRNQQLRNLGNRATYPQASAQRPPQAIHPPQAIQIAGQEHPAILRPRGSLEIEANLRPQPRRRSREERPMPAGPSRLSPVREYQEPLSPLPPPSAAPQPPTQDPAAMPGPSRLAAVPRHQRLPSSPTLGSFTWEGRQRSEGTWFNDNQEEDEDLDRAIALSLAHEANESR